MGWPMSTSEQKPQSRRRARTLFLTSQLRLSSLCNLDRLYGASRARSSREVMCGRLRRRRVGEQGSQILTLRMILASLWDTHAQRTESLRTGDTVRLVGVKVRENMNGEKEASTVFLTQLEKS